MRCLCALSCSGYLSGLLALLVVPLGGRVFAIERDARLLQRAVNNTVKAGHGNLLQSSGLRYLGECECGCIWTSSTTVLKRRGLYITSWVGSLSLCS